MQLLTQSKNNVSALELMRQLGVSYRRVAAEASRESAASEEEEHHGTSGSKRTDNPACTSTG